MVELSFELAIVPSTTLNNSHSVGVQKLTLSMLLAVVPLTDKDSLVGVEEGAMTLLFAIFILSLILGPILFPSKYPFLELSCLPGALIGEFADIIIDSAVSIGEEAVLVDFSMIDGSILIIDHHYWIVGVVIQYDLIGFGVGRIQRSDLQTACFHAFTTYFSLELIYP